MSLFICDEVIRVFSSENVTVPMFYIMITLMKKCFIVNIKKSIELN